MTSDTEKTLRQILRELKRIRSILETVMITPDDETEEDDDGDDV